MPELDALTRHKLVTAAIKHDKRREGKKGHNIYALAHYLGGIQRVAKAVEHGTSLASALYDQFNDRLLTNLEKAVGLEPTFGGGGHDKGRPDDTPHYEEPDDDEDDA